MRTMTWSAAAAVLLGGSASAQIFITDTLPGTFVDISSTGIPLGLGNDDEVDVPLSVFLGNRIVPAGSVLTVANNGGVGINTPIKDLDPTNTPLPSPGAFGADKALLAFWDDPGSDFGNVWIEERPERVIVQWARDFKGDPVPPRDTGVWQIQIIAQPDQEFCYAQYLYRDIEQPFPQGGRIATIGFQGGMEFNTFQWSFNQPFAVRNQTVLSVCPAPGAAGMVLLVAGAAARRRRR